MIQLPNGCYCGELTVTPLNWKQIGASIKKDWYISHRFYDPGQKIKYPKGLYRMIKGGINRYKDLAGRRKAVETQIAIHMAILKEGFNPITKIVKAPVELVYEIKPTTPFIKALRKSFDRLQVSRLNKYSIKSCLKWIEISSKKLNFDQLEIKEVRRKHIKLILEQCAYNQKRWSPQSFNHYRSYLMMLFKELVELDAIEVNPIKEISKKPIARKIRATLTADQRMAIEKHMAEHDPNLRRFVHIFFHSGSRISELSRLQGKDVDLKNQRFKIIIKKGKQLTEVWRPIKDIATDFWIEALENCRDIDFVFSRGINPWRQPVWPEYFTKRWQKVIKNDKSKGGLGINIDFYSLKHLNLDETAAQLDLQAAADMAGHTTPVITLKYAQGERDRQNERLKKVRNKFA